MSRPYRARGTLLFTLLLAAGCQEYNFNPVGHCLIQPGTKRVTLSNVSSADVLFVVDDSGSMGGEQSALATNFDRFIGNLDAANAARRAAGLEPFDFHIAVTTTSMFWNQNTDGWPASPWTCSSSCTGAAGQLVCCNTSNTPAQMPKKCTPGVTACSPGTTCGPDCISPFPGAASLKGENYCCVQGATTPTAAYPANYVGDTIPCSRAGVECGRYETHYNFAGCGESGNTNGVAMNGWPYPQGDFVAWTDATTANPRVLHFDKELYPETPDPNAKNKQGFTRQQLMDFFSGGGGRSGNVIVGVCGSGQEQALAAARAAIEKALGGRQTDTYARTSATPTPTWNATTRTAASSADWLAPGSSSKLVVVFVGDEDDCSPIASDPSGGVVWDTADLASGGIDSCALDGGRSPPLGGKLHSVESFVNFFTGLGRDVAAGFILPAAQQRCTLDGDPAAGIPACTSAGLCCPAGGCGTNQGAQQRGVRLLDTARSLAARGVDVVAGSICDGDFASLLESIAEIVKPPSGLSLPSVPAAGEVTLLRLVDSGGETRKVCNGPLPRLKPDGTAYNLADAQATGADWWFTVSANPGPPAPGTTQFVYINPNGSCQANPGETYSADYLGQLPARTETSPGGCTSDAECANKLGGSPDSWTCFAGVSGDPETCVDPATAPQRGTCICGSRAQNCPNG